jgi:uncharacterized protein YggE
MQKSNTQKTLIEMKTMIIIAMLAPSIILFGTFHSTFMIQAQLDSLDSLNNTIFVTGSASTNTKGDKVILSLGVDTINKTAEKALQSNSKLMNKVINALKESGVQQNETRTSSFTITPNYNYTQYGDRGILIGFTVSNSIQIESYHVANVSQWVDRAVQAGANTVNDITFAVSEKKLQDVNNNLLKEAVANAKSKADIVASAAGLHVAGIKSITVGEVSLPPLPVPIYSKSGSFDGESATPILAGEEEVSTTVNIVYTLGR